MAINITVKRIKCELTAERRERELGANYSGITFFPVDSTLTKLQGEISGPPGTPYEGGKFIVEIDVTDNYPFKPPKLRFVTKIWHPNVDSETGDTCLYKEDWVAGMTLRGILICVHSLLSDAEPDFHQDAVVAKQYGGNPEAFKLTARYWAQTYAEAPGSLPELDEKIMRLMAIGVDNDSACKTLSECSWNMEQAADLILLRNTSAVHSLVPDASSVTTTYHDRAQTVRSFDRRHTLQSLSEEQRVQASGEQISQFPVGEQRIRRRVGQAPTQAQMIQASTQAQMIQASAESSPMFQVPNGGQMLQSLTEEHGFQVSGGESRPLISSFDDKIKSLMNRGAGETASRDALSRCFWNLDKAADLLFGTKLDNPQETVVDQQKIENPSTNLVQGPSRLIRLPSMFDDKIKRLIDRGADESKAREALSKCFWNLEKAAELLFGESSGENIYLPG